jgi:hypothetical protein
MQPKPQTSDSPAPKTGQFDQLKLVHDYAKWHIGLYGASIAILISGKEATGFLPTRLLGFTIFLLLGSAACGAVLASSVLDPSDQYGFWKEGASNFWDTKVGPGKLKMMTMRAWHQVEHALFWMAAVLVVGSFIANVYGPKKVTHGAAMPPRRVCITARSGPIALRGCARTAAPLT